MNLPNKFTMKHVNSGSVYTVIKETEGYSVHWGFGYKVNYSDEQVQKWVADGLWTIVPEPVVPESVTVHNGIKIGDRVEIINDGKRYTTYAAWASEHGLTKYTGIYPGAAISDGDVATVVAIGPHRFASYGMLFGLEDSAGNQHIIGHDGIKLALEVQANGVDAEGKPLNFTADMLELFQRVKLRNGEVRIVVPNVQTGYRAKWALVNNQGWVEFDVEKPLEARAWDSVAVYAAPQELNIFSLNPEKMGALIWRAEDPQAKAKQARAEELQRQLVAAANEVAEATERMEAIKNELQSI